MACVKARGGVKPCEATTDVDFGAGFITSGIRAYGRSMVEEVVEAYMKLGDGQGRGVADADSESGHSACGTIVEDEAKSNTRRGGDADSDLKKSDAIGLMKSAKEFHGIALQSNKSPRQKEIGLGPLGGGDLGRRASSAESVSVMDAEAVEKQQHLDISTSGSPSINCGQAISAKGAAREFSLRMRKSVDVGFISSVHKMIRKKGFSPCLLGRIQFAWQDDCGDMREGGALLRVESEGRNYRDTGVSCYDEPGGGLSGRLGVSGEKGSTQVLVH
uniref:Uncharacterized protein n=2 Tax=Oryza sativa subsp. japonica TaxID=39947 RepID=A0A5S6R9X7_ORYSJ|nr:Hypothetical protein [Oryza sativa]AAP52119.1 hypothetical protein LOC_Os10g05770 [Oryza sativa Japonica Group]